MAPEAARKPREYAAGRDSLAARPPPDGTGRESLPLVHYVILRGDLPHGLQVANAIHAAGESGARLGRPLEVGTIAVALAVKDEPHLRELARMLDHAGLAFERIRESEGPYAGQWMALGIHPTTDRDAIRSRSRR